MKQKKIFFIGIFFITWLGSAQFKILEQSIKQPEIILPENQLDYFEIINKNLKKKIIDKTVTEYDKNGNIVSEIKRDTPFVTKSTYTYEKNVLVEKVTTVTSDSIELKRLNAQTLRDASRESQGQTESLVAVYDYINETSIYKAILGKKNRVVSYSEENSRFNNITKKQIKTQHQCNIIYDKDKIVEVNSTNYVEHFIYDKNLLVKKTVESISSNSKASENEEYFYDGNNNLTVIKKKRTSWYNDKIIEQINQVKDSAVYNENNKPIWIGTKEKYTTFKYNSDNVIIERTHFGGKTAFFKEEFFYDKNLITKTITTNYYSNGDANAITKTYNYKNGKLIDLEKKYSYVSMTEKTIYDYDDLNQIKKITDFFKYDKNKGEDSNFIMQNVTTFTYKQNSITIANKNGEIKVYEFY